MPHSMSTDLVPIDVKYRRVHESRPHLASMKRDMRPSMSSICASWSIQVVAVGAPKWRSTSSVWALDVVG
jgi:hypothetical protein